MKKALSRLKYAFKNRFVTVDVGTLNGTEDTRKTVSAIQRFWRFSDQNRENLPTFSKINRDSASSLSRVS